MKYSVSLALFNPTPKIFYLLYILLQTYGILQIFLSVGWFWYIPFQGSCCMSNCFLLPHWLLNTQLFTLFFVCYHLVSVTTILSCSFLVAYFLQWWDQKQDHNLYVHIQTEFHNHFQIDIILFLNISLVSDQDIH